MPQELNLDTVRLKMASELDEKEKAFIRENVNDLTDEDRDAYGEILRNGDAAQEENETEIDPGTPDTQTSESEASETSTTPEPTESTTPSRYSFESEEEAAAFVRKQLEENEKQKQAAIDAASTPAEKKWVEDNWKPKNWNEGIKTAAEAAADLVEERQRARAEAVDKQNQKIEADWQALRKENNLPDIRNEDGSVNEEGLAIHNSIVDLAKKHGKTNFKDAYDLWAIVPKDKGGGYEIPASDAGAALAEERKRKANEAKNAAAKLGAQNQGAGSVKGSSSLKPATYEDLKKPQSKLIKEAFE